MRGHVLIEAYLLVSVMVYDDIYSLLTVTKITMTLENPSAEKEKLTPAYEISNPRFLDHLFEDRNEEMKDSTETERNIAAALAVRFESTLLQIMKRTRNETRAVNRELNDAISDY